MDCTAVSSMSGKRWIVMPDVAVSCTVSNCVFHAKGNICGAEKIKIDMDYHSKNQHTEFASEFDAHMFSEKARHSANTCCQTFKPKEIDGE